MIISIETMYFDLVEILANPGDPALVDPNSESFVSRTKSGEVFNTNATLGQVFTSRSQPLFLTLRF